MSFILIDGGRWLVVVTSNPKEAQSVWEKRGSYLMMRKYESVKRFEVYCGTKLVESFPKIS